MRSQGSENVSSVGTGLGRPDSSFSPSFMRRNVIVPGPSASGSVNSRKIDSWFFSSEDESGEDEGS